MKWRSVDVVGASDRGVFEDEEARHFHLVVVACLHGAENRARNNHIS